MNLDSISRILTLRYDPLAKPARAPLSAKDFVPKKTADVEGRILEIIKDGLEDRREKLGFKRVSLSLSAGVDSGMTLAMLRKFLPDVKLDCISVGFDEKTGNGRWESLHCTGWASWIKNVRLSE